MPMPPFFEKYGKQCLLLLLFPLLGLSNCKLANNNNNKVISAEVAETSSAAEIEKQYPIITNIPTAETLRADKILVYFKTGEQKVILDSIQTAYINNLRAYLAQNEEAKIIITGHTDDRGDERMNTRLSRKRAEFVRDYLIFQGFSNHQIICKGDGPNNPITSNDTADGRRVNRRVEITLK